MTARERLIREMTHNHLYMTDERAAELVDAFAAELAKGQPLPSINARDVQGFCPACGHGVLMLGDGGYVTCTLIDCPQPDAASALLEARPA